MKIRMGFVSNSSSSSFTCSVCSEVFSGWDCSPSDFDHYECVYGHIFCGDQLVNKEKFYEACDRFEENWSENYEDLPKDWYEDKDRIEKYGLSDDDKNEVPIIFCPLCNFQNISSDDALSYIYKKYNITIEEVKKQIKEQFSSYKDFVKYLQEPSK